MTTHKHFFFLGAGAVAEAMIKGIVGAHVVSAEQIVVSNRRNGARLEELSGRYGVRVSRDRLEIAGADVVVLAMKPFDVMQALREVRSSLAERQLVVSVVAGVATAAIEGQVEGARARSWVWRRRRAGSCWCRRCTGRRRCCGRRGRDRRSCDAR